MKKSAFIFCFLMTVSQVEPLLDISTLDSFFGGGQSFTREELIEKQVTFTNIMHGGILGGIITNNATFNLIDQAAAANCPYSSVKSVCTFEAGTIPGFEYLINELRDAVEKLAEIQLSQKLDDVSQKYAKLYPLFNNSNGYVEFRKNVQTSQDLCLEMLNKILPISFQYISDNRNNAPSPVNCVCTENLVKYAQGATVLLLSGPLAGFGGNILAALAVQVFGVFINLFFNYILSKLGGGVFTSLPSVSILD